MRPVIPLDEVSSIRAVKEMEMGFGPGGVSSGVEKALVSCWNSRNPGLTFWRNMIH